MKGPHPGLTRLPDSHPVTVDKRHRNLPHLFKKSGDLPGQRMGPDDEPAVIRAREIKSALCRARAKEIEPIPSKGLYKSSGIRLKQGIISWQGVAQ